MKTTIEYELDEARAVKELVNSYDYLYNIKDGHTVKRALDRTLVLEKYAERKVKKLIGEKNIFNFELY